MTEWNLSKFLNKDEKFTELGTLLFATMGLGWAGLVGGESWGVSGIGIWYKSKTWWHISSTISVFKSSTKVSHHRLWCCWRPSQSRISNFDNLQAK